MTGETKTLRPLVVGAPVCDGAQWQGDALRIEVKKPGLFARLNGEKGRSVSLFESEVRRTASGCVGYRGLIKKEGAIEGVTASVSIRGQDDKKGDHRIVNHRPEREGDGDSIASDVRIDPSTPLVGGICWGKELKVEPEWRRLELVGFLAEHDQVVSAQLSLSIEGAGTLLLKDVELIE